MLQTALITARCQLDKACSIIASTKDAHLSAVLECVSKLYPAQLKEAAENLVLSAAADDVGTVHFNLNST